MTNVLRCLFAACAGLFAVAASAPADAQALDRILKEKKIRITAQVDSAPFGILDKDNKPTGSEIETARQIAKDLGVELELVQVTGPQRIPALLADRADLAISSLSITTDRAKTVWFASPHGALSIVIGGPARTNISGPADLVGKKIGMTRATLEEQEVPKIAPPGTQIVFFDEHAATQQALMTGQVDAIGAAAFHFEGVEAAVAADVEDGGAAEVGGEDVLEGGPLGGGVIAEEVMGSGGDAAELEVVEPGAQLGDAFLDLVSGVHCRSCDTRRRSQGRPGRGRFRPVWRRWRGGHPAGATRFG